jgi:hypothetical protein
VQRGHYERARFGTVVDARGPVLAAALRTPPHNLMCTRLPDPAIATMYVWDDAGSPTSLIAVRPPVDGAARIGPVYTPGALRRRGYAGSGVAAVSRRLLGAGADVCMLFTDLANPTSNKIYGEVGYRRFADWEDHRFSAGPAS